MPQFKYFLSNRKNPVHEGDSLWSSPIPFNRHQTVDMLESETDRSIRHGEYFWAVRDFLEKNRFSLLKRCVSHHIRRDITIKEIKEIRIFLDKHGEFYHPAKIDVVMPGTTLPFVLNVAVSDTGKRCVQRECQLLKQFREDFSFSFVPGVYGQGSVSTKNEKFEIKMFLGEWFEGFNEFHISFDPEDEQCKIAVWDHIHGNYFLTTDQTMELYRQVSKILTYYYDVMTFKQIVSWHHAAGDFVLKCRNDDVAVKLITVRHYRSMFEIDHADQEKDSDDELILEALLVFFLNMAIKMRVDRMDGVGEIVWADPIAIEGTLKGFLEGLTLKPMTSRFSAPLADCFRKHLLAFSRTDFLDLSRSIVDTYHPQSPEVPVIRHHLEKHVDNLYHAVNRLK